MCGLSNILKPKTDAPKPTAAPEPAERSPNSPALNETATGEANDRNRNRSNRKGTSSLRINLAVGNGASGGTGLNVPKV
jgi:hypothetical protein